MNKHIKLFALITICLALLSISVFAYINISTTTQTSQKLPDDSQMFAETEKQWSLVEDNILNSSITVPEIDLVTTLKDGESIIKRAGGEEEVALSSLSLSPVNNGFHVSGFLRVADTSYLVLFESDATGNNIRLLGYIKGIKNDNTIKYVSTYSYFGTPYILIVYSVPPSGDFKESTTKYGEFTDTTYKQVYILRDKQLILDNSVLR